jgi:uncharacterized membrane protein (DUF4010 family)
VLRRLWPPVVAGALVLSVVVAAVYRGAARNAGLPEREPEGAAAIPVGRPFSLRPALILTAVLVSALLVGRWGADVLGPQGAVLAAFAAGLADAHAGSVAAATLSAQGGITVGTALAAIAAALGSNLLVKVVLAFTAGGRRFGVRFAAGMAAPTAVFAAVLTAVTVFG